VIPRGTVIRRKRDDAVYGVASLDPRGNMYFLTSRDGTGWPSCWENAETIAADYEVIALPRDISEADVRAAQARAGTRAMVRRYVRVHRAAEAMADELGLEAEDVLPRDREGMWTRVWEGHPE
jgi:hypothetical protein